MRASLAALLAGALGTAAASLGGCRDDGAPPAPSATPMLPGARDAAVATGAPTLSTSPVSRPFCHEPASGLAPDSLVETVYAPDAKALPGRVRFGAGSFTWVVFWASWCKPCYAEIPLLLGWRERLVAEGVPLELAFVSVDDVREELVAFLEAQPLTGLRASYWLPLELRRAWVDPIGIPDRTKLPAHSLVDPAGSVACHFLGSLEDVSYSAVAAFFAARRR
ncbi:MAG: redoxin domain-containing protein [Polyangiaceae bacterium]|nr:redoxin domain-containing protein [Polyangiaceae bacterium]